LWPVPKGRIVKFDLPVGLGIDGIAARSGFPGGQ
jgi:hypothetical protein